MSVTDTVSEGFLHSHARKAFASLFLFQDSAYFIFFASHIFCNTFFGLLSKSGVDGSVSPIKQTGSTFEGTQALKEEAICVLVHDFGQTIFLSAHIFSKTSFEYFINSAGVLFLFKEHVFGFTGIPGVNAGKEPLITD